MSRRLQQLRQRAEQQGDDIDLTARQVAVRKIKVKFKSDAKADFAVRAKSTRIGKGSYGCVYHPPLSCKVPPAAAYRNLYQSGISKLMSRKDALSEYMRAQHLGLERIDPAQEYMIYPIFNCELELSSYEGDCPITGTVLDTLLFSRNGGRELFKVVLEVTTFDRAQALVYAFMRVFATIQLLHDHEIYHLDLKLPNMLIDRSDTIRVIDFGLSASLDDLVTSYAPVFDNPYVYWPIETVLLAKPIRGHRAILKYIRAMNADRFIKHVFPPNWLEQYVNWAWFANQYQSLRQPSTRRAAVKTIAEAVEVYSLGMIIRQYFASHSFGSRIYGLLPASVQTDIRTLASEMLSIDITQRLTLPAATQRWRALCMQYNVRLKI